MNNHCKLPLGSDNNAYRFPVSVKGVFFLDNGKIPLLLNERDEFELPGGKLELNEQPEKCLIREIKEETNLNITTEQIIDSWIYHIDDERHVLIVTYGCIITDKKINLIHSNEHKKLEQFSIHEVNNLKMPSGYLQSIQRWAKFINIL
ncbi:MAG TPA: NUDIX hydrolase [Coxiellaceae bacterium]|nr:MAG: hypothetical protein A3E81_03195 [Gammaproteobacteria bacterium RIFCSPHIGHO2_12_FULL_36_30]HLB56391.1 NUDIX hydrolase [Coxiellaceae bacterium]